MEAAESADKNKLVSTRLKLQAEAATEGSRETQLTFIWKPPLPLVLHSQSVWTFQRQTHTHTGGGVSPFPVVPGV